jgi:hypothetical protein
MLQRDRWTEAADTRLRRLRAEGHTWDAIAAAFGLSRWTVIERGRRIGARRPPVLHPPRPDPARGPRPPGHPETWGLITRGTCLEGAAYPLPVIADR